jgi:cytochrome c551/c552
MRGLIGFVCIGLILAAVNVAAEDGEAIFKAQGCISCHRPTSSSKVNPSLADIAQAYQGKEDQLLIYLKGEGDPIVKPEKAGMMKRHLKKTEALSDPDRKALAEYLLSHGK